MAFKLFAEKLYLSPILDLFNREFVFTHKNKRQIAQA